MWSEAIDVTVVVTDLSPGARGTAAPGLRAAGDEVMPGRAVEQTTVRDLLQRVRQGRGGVVLVEGEPGIGRSLLLRGAADDRYGVIVDQTADHLGQYRRVPGAPGGQGQQPFVRWRAERVGEQAGHSIITERAEADASGTIALQQAEQALRLVPLCTAPGQDPTDRVPSQLPW